jgi:MscS family membrane protein
VSLLDLLAIDLRDVMARGMLIGAGLVGLWLLRYMAAWLLTRAVDRVTRRLGGETMRRQSHAIIYDTTQILFYALAVLVIGEILDLDENSRLFVARLSRTLFVIAAAVSIYRILALVSVTRLQMRRLTGINIDEALLPFLRIGMQLVTMAFAIVIIVQVWGYDISALVAGLGIGGLAISLAAQDTIANLFGFSMIVGDRPFVVGDYIKTPDVEGVVEFVGLRSTRVRQTDQALVTVPNKLLANSVIANWSRLNKRMIEFTLRTPPTITGETLVQLMAEIRSALLVRARVEADSVMVNFTHITEGGYDVLVSCYVLLADWGDFAREREAINLEIMRIVGENLGLGAAQGQPSAPTSEENNSYAANIDGL